MNHRRILIFSGGNLGAWALNEVQPGDYLIGADRGAMFLLEHGLTPDEALGDFDSVTPQQFQEIAQLSRKFAAVDAIDKDQSDTEMAFNCALQHKPAEIILLGALGTRFDHALSNVHLLFKGLQQGVACRIVDEYNEIMATDSHLMITKSRYSYVSLLPLTLAVTGITLQGFQYPLHQAELQLGQSLAVSNTLVANSATIDIGTGVLLVIQSID